jgi:hypothetical protein
MADQLSKLFIQEYNYSTLVQRSISFVEYEQAALGRYIAGNQKALECWKI